MGKLTLPLGYGVHRQYMPLDMKGLARQCAPRSTHLSPVISIYCEGRYAALVRYTVALDWSDDRANTERGPVLAVYRGKAGGRVIADAERYAHVVGCGVQVVDIRRRETWDIAVIKPSTLARLFYD